MNVIKLVMFLLYLLSFFSSCEEENNSKQINLMRFAVEPYNLDSCEIEFLYNSKYKIITYGNLSCRPCWEKVLEWNSHIQYFDNLDNVSVFCYVYSSRSKFDSVYDQMDVNIPVFLDAKYRFPLVNNLSAIPQRLTFLLDENNEVLLVGPPFTPEMKSKYMEIILGEE